MGNFSPNFCEQAIVALSRRPPELAAFLALLHSPKLRSGHAYRTRVRKESTVVGIPAVNTERGIAEKPEEERQLLQVIGKSILAGNAGGIASGQRVLPLQDCLGCLPPDLCVPLAEFRG